MSGDDPQRPIDAGGAPVPLHGLRVVELAHWVAGPAVGGILADWGADVVKVEPPEGDPMRSLFAPPPGTTSPGSSPGPGCCTRSPCATRPRRR